MKIVNGIYLVVDPSMRHSTLIDKIEQSAAAGLSAVQIWDNFPQTENPQRLFRDISVITRAYGIPLLINNRVEFLKTHAFDGIHFDNIPDESTQRQLPSNCIKGLTCNNDMTLVEWVNENGFDYISFCSVFPSSTSNSCDLVAFDSIKQARAITDVPIFLAGGINMETVEELHGLEYSGLAMVSGIMNAEDSYQAVASYAKVLVRNKIL